MKNKLLHFLGHFSITAVLLVMLLINGNISKGQSFTNTLVANSSGCNWPYSALAYNSSNEVFAIWKFENTYNLIKWTGASWTTIGSFTSDQAKSGYFATDDVSLAIDLNGTFHVTFRLIQNAACCGQQRGVFYAKSANGVVWTYNEIETFSDPNGWLNTDDPLISFDASNYPHIGYLKTDANGGRMWTIRYWRFNGSTWIGETAFSEGGNASNEITDIGFDLDGNGKAHFAFQYETDGSGLDGGLWYINNTLGSWPVSATELIHGVYQQEAGYNPNIEIDAANKVHIMSSDWQDHLVYSTNVTGSFTHTWLNGSMTGSFQRHSFHLNSNNDKILMYKTPAAPIYMKWAYQKGGESCWQTGDAFPLGTFTSVGGPPYSATITNARQVVLLVDAVTGSCNAGNPRKLYSAISDFSNVSCGASCPTITFTATPTNTCSGGSNGQIVVSGITGGTGPYTYSKDNGINYQGSATFTGLSANTYQVMVKDANSCTSVASPVVIGTFPLTSVTCPANLATCPGGTPITLSGGNPVGGTYSGNGVSGGIFTPTFALAGDNIITYSFLDANNCTFSCTFIINVSDNQAPIISTCTQNVVTTAGTSCTALVIVSQPAATDNCVGCALSFTNSFNNTSDASGYYPLGTTTVTWTVSDCAGNTSTCNFTVNVSDLTPPSITCPPDMTVNALPGTCAATVNYGGSSGIFGASPFQDSAWIFNDITYEVIQRFGPTIAGYSITGINSVVRNPANGLFYAILKLSSVSGRVLATINVTTGVASWIGNLGDNFASLTFKPDGTLYGVTGNGATVPETLYYIDPATAVKTLATPLGNGADGEVIVFNPDDGFIYHWSGNSTVVYEKIDPATWAITNIPITSPYSGEIFGAVYLGSGEFLVSNISSNFRKLTTAGVMGPVLSNNPDDIRGMALMQGIVATDNCSTPTISYSIPEGSSFPVGTTAVTMTATDAAGNTSTCIFNVIVEEHEPPVISCPSAMTGCYNPAIGGSNISFTVTASDLCSTVSIISTPASGSIFPLGTTTVVAVATDASGNSSSCSFTVTIEGFAGSVTVGSGGNYPDLTGAGGLFQAINTNGLCSDLTVDILSDLSESGLNPLNQWVDHGGTWSMTIRPGDATEKLISGSVANSLIRFNGTDRVVVDGKYGGSGKYLRFRNTNTAFPTLSLANGASTNSFFDVFFDCSNTSGSSGGVYMNGADNTNFTDNVFRNYGPIPANLFCASLNMTYGSFNNSFWGNSFSNFGQNGILVSGGGTCYNWIFFANGFYYDYPSPATLAQCAINFKPVVPANVFIDYNVIGGSMPDNSGTWLNSGAVTVKGISTANSLGDYNGNIIKNFNLTNAGLTTFIGIEILSGDADIHENIIGSESIANSINLGGLSNFFGIRSMSASANVQIHHNIIANATATAATGYPNLYGIYVRTGSITKNRIFKIGSSSNLSLPSIYGIENLGFPGLITDYANNRVALDGGNAKNPKIFGIQDNGYSATSPLPSARYAHNSVEITGLATTSAKTYAFQRNFNGVVEIMNNIFANKRTTSPVGHYAISSANTTNWTSNYNDLTTSSTWLGYWGAANRTTLAVWKAATAQDVNSISVAPVFTSDLHLDAMLNPALNNVCPALAWVTDDIDNEVRAGLVDFGADEIGAGPRLEQAAVASAYGLTAYPNPFTNSIQLSVNVSQDSKIILSMYNMLGDKLADIAEENLSAGTFDYTFNANNLPAGVYVCRMIVMTGDKTDLVVRRLVKDR